MDKLKKIFSKELKKLEEAFSKELDGIPTWKIDSLLPQDYKSKSIDEKKSFLLDRFKKVNPIYSMIFDDQIQIENSNYENLKIFNVDPRILESNGVGESQIKDFYYFVESVKKEID